MEYHFASIFDHHYFSRAIALYESLEQTGIDFSFYAIALTPECIQLLERLNKDNIQIISLQEIESYYPELELVKKQRSQIDYVFTLSPYYPSYIFVKHSHIDHICSLDADQYFFSNPKEIFDLLSEGSILITPHRFSQKQIEEGYEVNGKYNVSFQVFKNNSIGKACLELWRKQCIDWCEDKAIDGKFADQKYLETWQGHFPSEVIPIDHVGLGLAPWNISQYQIKERKGVIMVNDSPFILFHYQGMRILSDAIIRSGLDAYKATASKIIRNKIYYPIVKSILKNNPRVDAISRGKQSFKIGKEFFKIRKHKLQKMTIEYWIQETKASIKKSLSVLAN